MKSLMVAVLYVLLTGQALAEEAEVKVFAIQGERLQYQPPQGWKIAYMEGTPDGDYVIEYLPDGENLASWRTGYLSIRRKSLPSENIMDQIKAKKLHLPALVVAQLQQGAKQGCQGKFEAMSHRDNTYNNLYFSVSGGFCGKYGSAAPYGEGSIVAVVEAKANFFTIQYGWRPVSDTDLKDYAWRITPENAEKYIKSIMRMRVCEDAAACQP
jgi:hypothetical protein